LIWFACTLLWIALPVQARADILVVSPHPDDDIITAAGVVRRAIQRGEGVRIVYVTNGDFVSLSLATVRQGEAVVGQGHLGTAENRLSFLGYPDGHLSTIHFNYTSPGSAFTSPHGISSTYASRGLGGTDYHTYRFGSPGLYNWPTMVGDLADIINTQRPTHIFTTSQWDTHSDHSTTYFLVRAATEAVVAANPGYNPTIHKTSVWPGDGAWPLPSDGSTYFTPFNHVGINDPTELIWSERESLDVPSPMQVTFSPLNGKYLAISAHDSQGGMSRYIGQWVHKDEFFWTEQVTGTNRPPVPNAGLDQTVDEGVLVTLDGSASWDRNGGLVTHQWRQVAGPPVTLSSLAATRPTFTSPTGLSADTILEFELVVSDGALTSVPDAVRVIVRSALPPPSWGPNVAPLATFTTSSERNNQGGAKVADGFIDGYPGDATREWVTVGQGVGAWIQMNWSTPQTIGKVVLYDRPNLDDQLLAGVITFSDGSTLPVGPLVNNASASEYVFAPRTVTSLRLTVTQVGSHTANVGLAEFQVFEIGGINRAPTANAGPDQVVAGGQVVTLNGTGSSDPNNDPLQYVWSQTSGPAVTLSSGSAAMPTFTAPAALPGVQTLRFSLVVRDNEFTSPADTVEIIIPGTVNSPPNANAGPDAVVSAGAAVTLNGSASADPEGVPITYLWTQTAGPGVTLSSTTAAMPTFTVPAATPDTVLTFELVVSDGVHTSAADSVSITVVALPTPTSNIAPVATVTASTERAPTQAAIKAVDTIVDGYPGVRGVSGGTVGSARGA
jgi:LmbE family N-acetylglucosaminyl deacetylase